MARKETMEKMKKVVEKSKSLKSATRNNTRSAGLKTAKPLAGGTTAKLRKRALDIANGAMAEGLGEMSSKKLEARKTAFRKAATARKPSTDKKKLGR